MKTQRKFTKGQRVRLFWPERPDMDGRLGAVCDDGKGILPPGHIIVLMDGEDIPSPWETARLRPVWDDTPLEIADDPGDPPSILDDQPTRPLSQEALRAAIAAEADAQEAVVSQLAKEIEQLDQRRKGLAAHWAQAKTRAEILRGYLAVDEKMPF